MTGPRSVHPEYEELISASLTDDLTERERVRLDAHLDTCDACRATLAAFADERRIVSGLRHVPVPRDLHARVRTGIERGVLAEVPWWRRPAVLFAGVGGSLAAVAGAMLALVVLNQDPGPVGNATPTPEPTSSPTSTVLQTAVPSPTPSEPARATLPPVSTAEPTLAGSASPAPTPEQTPRPSAVPTAPEPDIYLGHTGPFDNRALVAADVEAGETTELETPPGPPIAAALSPDGQHLAYIVRVGEKGTHEVRVTRVGEAPDSDDPDAPEPVVGALEVGQTALLGESMSDDPFLEQLFWSSPRGAYLAYTLADPEDGDADVWIFDASTGEHGQATDTGNTYAASWIPDDTNASSTLWVSAAGERPVSYAMLFTNEDRDGPVVPRDPSDNPVAVIDGVFQPLLNPDGRFAIYWDGAMARGGEDATGPWRFTAGAQPYLAYHVFEDELAFDAESERPLFRDLSVGREAFTSASVTWGPDGDTYAVWDARWTGVPQVTEDGSDYPDPSRVYFSRATDRRGMTSGQAIDADDLPEGWSVVDVKISPTGEHLAIAVARPLAGTLDAPEADLLLVDRNFGDESDLVTVLAGEDDEFWWGPAAFDAR